MKASSHSQVLRYDTLLSHVRLDSSWYTALTCCRPIAPSRVAPCSLRCSVVVLLRNKDVVLLEDGSSALAHHCPETREGDDDQQGFDHPEPHLLRSLEHSARLRVNNCAHGLADSGPRTDRPGGSGHRKTNPPSARPSR